ncbi:splicing regulator RBM11 isoform X2 [Lissotriton helveticus]
MHLTTISLIFSYFRAGPLTKVRLCKDKEGKPKSFGFVCFKHTDSVPYAIALLNEIRLYGRPIKLQYQIGSSHLTDLTSPYQGIGNSTSQDPSIYSNEWPSDNFAFPPIYGTHDAPYFYPPPFFFQGVDKTGFTPHCGTVAQQPYLQMVPQPSAMWPTPPYTNAALDIVGGPTSTVHQTQRGHEFQPLAHNNRKRKRKLQVSKNESDSSVEKKRRENAGTYDQTYRKFKGKKRYGK